MALTLLGAGLKALSNHNKKVTVQNNEQRRQAIQAEINMKTDQYRTLDAKWFKTSAEKNEIARLKREIAELESQLS